MWQGHLLKTWSRTQATLALSSGEAELSAIVKGTAEALGARAMMEDFGIKVRLVVRSDAMAALGMVRRLGLGKVRHLAIGDLWVQEIARSGQVEYRRIGGAINPADLMTKGLGPEVLRRLSSMLGLEARDGRPAVAPQARGRVEDRREGEE